MRRWKSKKQFGRIEKALLPRRYQGFFYFLKIRSVNESKIYPRPPRVVVLLEPRVVLGALEGVLERVDEAGVLERVEVGSLERVLGAGVLERELGVSTGVEVRAGAGTSAGAEGRVTVVRGLSTGVVVRAGAGTSAGAEGRVTGVRGVSTGVEERVLGTSFARVRGVSAGVDG